MISTSDEKEVFTLILSQQEEATVKQISDSEGKAALQVSLDERNAKS